MSYIKRIQSLLTLLEQIAKTADGQYYRATSNSKLKEVYEEIDKLERTKLNVKDFSRKSEEYIPFAIWETLYAPLLATVFAYLIGLPVLRLKSDYLAIATLGFAEILRAFFQWNALGPITNGSNLLKSYPVFSKATPYVLLTGVMVAVIMMLINSTYGRAFKAIRDDEVAAEAMGINLAKHKRMAFIISSFFAGIGGGMMAMYMGTIAAAPFKSTLTYEILLIVVIGGIGSITGSIIASFLYIFSSEWLLRGLDSGTFLGINAPDIFKNGFRMVVFSVILMIVVLFFRQGIMGKKEFSWNFILKRMEKKEQAKTPVGGEGNE